MPLITTGILLGAIHLNGAPARLTPGLYLETQDQWIGAIYRNSQGHTSLMAGKAFTLGPGEVQAGLVSGYRPPVKGAPFYLAYSVKLGQGARLTLTPKALALGWDF